MDKKNEPSTSKSKEDNPDEMNEMPEQLNILSEFFDPMQALYSDSLKKTVSGIKQYSNISSFESALEKVGIQQVGKKQTPQPNAEQVKTQTNASGSNAPMAGRRFLEHQMPVKGKPVKVRHQRNLLKKMEEYKEGPLSILYDAWKSQKRIIVHVRKEHGIRGYIHGFLIAFDKHTNLMIRDGYEIWKRRKFKFSSNNATLGTPKNCSERLKKLGIVLPENHIKSVDRKYVIIKRKINQILIRGEQVCIVRLSNRNDEEKLEKCIL